MVEYVVGPQTERLLYKYWEVLTMVSRLICYYGSLFKEYRGVTQGNPLSPTIFNMVVDAVIHHCLVMVAGEYAGLEGFGRAVQNMDTLFYEEDRLLASPQPARLKEALYILTGLFNRLGLRKTWRRHLVWSANHDRSRASNWRRPTPGG